MAKSRALLYVLILLALPFMLSPSAIDSSPGSGYGVTLGGPVINKGSLFFFTAASGAKVGGKDNAGAILSARFDALGTGFALRNIKNFNRNNLMGSTSMDDFFGLSFTSSRLFRSTGP